MKFFNYTNADALFSCVVIDFPFLRLNQYFEIAKFVYYVANISIFVNFLLILKEILRKFLKNGNTADDAVVPPLLLQVL